MNNYIEILNQVWNLKDYQAATYLAWRWYEHEILPLDVLIDFATYLLKNEEELSNKEIYYLEDFLIKCDRIKLFWG